MGRELRRVPKDWEHPKYCGTDKYEPLLDGYEDALGEFSEYVDSRNLQDALEYFGGGPVKSDYMPTWDDSERTHYQAYETCTEGTPISPVLESPEAVARWCADNGASVFGSQTASYEEWIALLTGQQIGVLVSGTNMVAI